jgi:hypothetical protein
LFFGIYEYKRVGNIFIRDLESTSTLFNINGMGIILFVGCFRASGFLAFQLSSFPAF